MLNYKIISIYTSESARAAGTSRPLYDAVVEYVRSLKTSARCMVSRGNTGCYENGEVATTRIELLMINLPIHVQIVLPSAEVEPVLAKLETMVEDGVVGVQSFEVV